MKKISLKIRFEYLLICLVPAVLAALCFRMKLAVGPYWLGNNSDPSYLYLFNSLYLLDGIAPVFTDHPGTPLQLLIALVVKVFNWNVGMPEVLRRVFDNPEYYLNIAYYALYSLYIASTLMLGVYVYRKTHSLVVAICYQIPGFFYLFTPSYNSSVIALPIVSNINSETLMLTGINLFLLCLARLLYKNEEDTGFSSAVFIGLVCGFTVATKFTFLSMLLIPLLLLPKAKHKIVFFVVTVAAFFVFTIPIWPRYALMWEWIKGLIFKVELHGGGRDGFVDPRSYLGGLVFLFRENAVLVFCMIIGFIFGVYRVIKEKGGGSRGARSLFVIAGVGLFHFLFIAKQRGVHYATPALGLSGIVLSLIYGNMRKSFAKKCFVVSVMILVIVLMGIGIFYQQKLSVVNKDLVDFYYRIHKKYDSCHIIPHYRASSPYYALEFGDDCHVYNQYGSALDKQFPNQYFYHFWHRNFQSFDKNVFFQHLLQRKPCVMIYGGSLRGTEEYFQSEVVEKAHNETLYRILETSLDLAHVHYIQAVFFGEKKQYKEALAHAFKAKKFGHASVEGYIQQLKGHIINSVGE